MMDFATRESKKVRNTNTARRATVQIALL